MVCIPDDIVPSLKIGLLGTIFSAIAYGIVIVLSGNCFHLIQKTRGTYSNRMRIFLLIYIAFMFLLSTLALVQSIWRPITLIFPLKDIHILLYEPIALLFTTWGADGFMVRVPILLWEQRFTFQLQIWRCFILYQDISKGRRVVIIVLLSLLSFTSFGSSISLHSTYPDLSSNTQGFGIMTIVQNASSRVLYHNNLGVFTLFSTIVNIILAALIVFRLVYHRRRIQKVLGPEHGSLYSNIMTMCIESSALIVISSGLLTILTFTLMDEASIMYLLLPYVCVSGPGCCDV